MKFSIHPEIFEKFPHLRIGVVVGKGLKNGKRGSEMDNLINENISRLVDRVGEKNLSDFPNIAAWRETYRQFGTNPNKFKPTAESFLKRVLKSPVFPSISKAVEAYLAVELITMLPIGGYDLTKINGDIVLRISKGNESFLPLGGGAPELTNPGEIIYSDNRIVLTRNWNYRDSDETKIVEESEEIFLASEAALPEISSEDLKLTIEKIAEYETIYCGGTYQTYFLDRDTPEVHI